MMATDEEEAKPTTRSDSEEQAPKDAEEPVVSASHTELQSNSTKEAAGGASAGEASQSKEPTKDEDMIPISENKEADALVVSNSTEKKDSAGTDFLFCFLFHQKVVYVGVIDLKIYQEVH